MNTQVDIKPRRLLFTPAFITLVITVASILVLDGPSVQAQTTAPAVDSSITIATNGTVNDPGGAITISGSVTIKCRRVIDTATTTTPPLIMLDFDFSQIKGTTGNGKNQKTFVTGDNHATELRPFQASDTIVVTVPYYDNTKDILSASSFMVTANLNFDISTGKITSGSLTYGSNIFTSTGLGTFTVN
jgi:hypothetical protein